MEDRKFDSGEFDRRVQARLRQGRVELDGQYKDHLAELMGLSGDEIKAIAPLVGMEKYDELIAVVREASRMNVQEAQLREQIEKLGTVALAIAKRVPKLAAIL